MAISVEEVQYCDKCTRPVTKNVINLSVTDRFPARLIFQSLLKLDVTTLSISLESPDLRPDKNFDRLQWTPCEGREENEPGISRFFDNSFCLIKRI